GARALPRARALRRPADDPLLVWGAARRPVPLRLRDRARRPEARRRLDPARLRRRAHAPADARARLAGRRNRYCRAPVGPVGPLGPLGPLGPFFFPFGHSFVPTSTMRGSPRYEEYHVLSYRSFPDG